MKPRSSKKRNSGMTLFEVGVVIAVVMILVVIILPSISITRRSVSRVSCAGNLKQICLTYRVWADDNGGKFPMGISVTNGGTMELAATGDVVQTFLVMSNELSTPRILYCAWDTAHTATSLFVGLSSSNISYFIGADVTNDTNPQLLVSGDDNFEIGGVPVKSGLLELPTNAPIAWSAARHKFSGNYGLADGSVYQVTTNGLRHALQQTGLATNRLALP